MELKSKSTLNPLRINSVPGLNDAIKPAIRGKTIIKDNTAKNAVAITDKTVLFVFMPIVSFSFTEDVFAILIFLLLKCSVQYKLNYINS